MGLLSTKQLSQDDQRKWAPLVLLQPLPFAVHAFIVIFIGPIMINATRRPEPDTESLTTLYPYWRCATEYPPTSAITDEAKSNNPMFNLFLYWLFNIIVCYIFQMTFCWTFLGFPITINDLFKGWNSVFGIEGYTVKVGNFDVNIGTKFHMLSDSVNFHIARAYTSLRWVAAVYTILFILAIGVNFMGLGMMMGAQAEGCFELNPKIYYFTLYQVVVFLILFFLKMFSACRACCKTSLGRAFQQGVRAKYQQATTEEDDTKFARSKFMQYDQGSDPPSMDSEDLEHLLLDLGIRMNDAEIERIKNEMDNDGEGTISLDEFMAWYAKSNEETQNKKKPVAEESSEEESSEESD